MQSEVGYGSETSLNGKCLRLSLSFRLFGNVVADELTVGVAISVKFMLKTMAGLYVTLLRSTILQSIAADMVV